MASEQTLNVAFLWHQHQPYYKVAAPDGKPFFAMPWVRLHGVKDYFDIPNYLTDFPTLKQNFNLVPSLLMQIEDYTEHGVEDHIMRLTRLPAGQLNEHDREQIIDDFFLAHEERMIAPNPRYKELLDRRSEWRQFSVEDWCDLQMWYNLCWIGESWKTKEPFRSWIQKGRGFSESDKAGVLAAHLDILRKIIPLYRRLAREQQIEISVTPLYHPILPLLNDTAIAQKSNPHTTLSEKAFVYPDDAHWHIRAAREFFQSRMGFAPRGMWPSEGSVSQAVIGQIAEEGFRWVATDEEILMRSESRTPGDPYQPYRIRTSKSEVVVLFRDHGLSDAIGFRYAAMPPEKAAAEFVSHLEAIREDLIRRGLDPSQRLVSIILDGENCWEYYPNNGREFLRALYLRLSTSQTIETVRINDYLMKIQTPQLPEIHHIHPGSWIAHNFDVWIGSHPEKNTAWEYLTETRLFLETARKSGKYTFEKLDHAWEMMAIAEGSDWFWWMGDDHQARHKTRFDVLFRYFLRRVYDALGEPAHEKLFVPIMADRKKEPVLHRPKALLRPRIDGKESSFYEWRDAGFYAASKDADTMSGGQVWFDSIQFGFDEHYLYIRLNFSPDQITLLREKKFTVQAFFDYEGQRVVHAQEVNAHTQDWAFGEIAEWRIIRSRIPLPCRFSVGLFDGRNNLETKPLRGGIPLDPDHDAMDRDVWSA